MSSTKPELHAVGHSNALLVSSAWTPPVVAMQTQVSHNVQHASPGLRAPLANAASHAPSLAREPTMTRRHARAVAPGLSQALTTPHASHAPTYLGRSSACLASSARSVKARVRRWTLIGRAALHVPRGKSLMRRRRDVSTAVTIGTQRLEFVKTVHCPTSSPATEVHAVGHSNAPLVPSAWTPPAVAMQTQVSHNVQHALPGL